MLLFKIQLVIDVLLSLFVNCLIHSESWTAYDQLCIETENHHAHVSPTYLQTQVAIQTMDNREKP